MGVSTDPFNPGDRLGQYEIVRLLGRGGMGVVYLANHAVLGRQFAVKVLPEEFVAQRGFLERFKTEARVMANLEHPNIVRVDDFGETAGRYWLRMEAVLGADGGGSTLADLAKADGGRIAAKRLQPIIEQVLGALACAHEHGIVHRDMKPANVLIARDGSAKVSDFGLVKLVGEDLVRSQVDQSISLSMSLGDSGAEVGSSTRSMLGTYEYMSPEQKRREELDARSDLYSVGLMAFRLLTGQDLPGFDLPSQIDESIPAWWDDFVRQSVAPSRDRRVASAGAALKLLGVPARPAAPPPPPRREEARPKPPPAPARRGQATLYTGWPFDEREAKRRQQETAEALGIPVERSVDLGKGVSLELVLIPPGEFLMGSPKSEEGQGSDETQHRVRITRPFYIGKYAVTQEQWEAVMGKNPASFKGARNPVDLVSWEDCQEFVGKLSGRGGNGSFALPTEAEWEYACRAGTATGYCCGDHESGLADYAWNYSNSGSVTHPVGEKKPNAWGLYDMHGNVWEWCQDWYDADYYKTSPKDDPPGARTGELRVLRGGSWCGYPGDCRSAFRNGGYPSYRSFDVGVRLCVRDVP
jgi:formylglycine-generating enzyme required for sulfatase activity/tRNA A-37 threonylcarbamoyl transferase component Bud32